MKQDKQYKSHLTLIKSNTQTHCYKWKLFKYICAARVVEKENKKREGGGEEVTRSSSYQELLYIIMKCKLVSIPSGTGSFSLHFECLLTNKWAGYFLLMLPNLCTYLQEKFHFDLTFIQAKIIFKL